VYGHLYSVSVAANQNVNTSTQIGVEGNTDVPQPQQNGGMHTHFEINFIPNAEGNTSYSGSYSMAKLNTGGPPPGGVGDCPSPPSSGGPRPAGYFYDCYNWDDGVSNPTSVSAGQTIPFAFAGTGGRGTDTIGVYQKWGSGLWYFANGLEASTAYTVAWGGSGWSQLTGDWNNDGVDTIGVADDSQPVNYMRNNVPPYGGEFGFWLGYSWFAKVTGDWNNDGISTEGFVSDDPGFGSKVWYLYNSNSNGPGNYSGATGSWSSAFHFGPNGYPQTTGDFDCNGTTDVAVMQSAGGGNIWYISVNGGGLWTNWYFGNPGDQPVAGDWDGDGCDSIGVYRPSNGTWYLKNVSSTSAGTWDYTISGYGGSSDTAIIGDWNGQ